MKQSTKPTETSMPAASEANEEVAAVQPVQGIAVGDILRGTAHALTIFKPEAIAGLSIFLKRGQALPDLLRHRQGTPRQARRNRPAALREDADGRLRLSCRTHRHRKAGADSGPPSTRSRADIVIWDKDDPNAAYIIVECKKPKRSDGLEQLKSYCNAEGSPIGVWTNGGETIHPAPPRPELLPEPARHPPRQSDPFRTAGRALDAGRPGRA